MAAQPIPKTAVIPAGEGRVLRAFGEEVTVLLDGNQTGGKFVMISELTPPGGGPPPHYHLNEEEWFYVIEGRVSFLKDGQWTEVAPGGVVFVPRGVVHAFKNVGDTPLRQIIHTAPSGFDIFFVRCAWEFSKPGGPDMNRIVAIATEHGIHFQS